MNRFVTQLAIAGFWAAMPIWGQVVTVSPSTAAVHVGTTFLFSSTVTGVSPTTLTWTVALPTGGTGLPGSISGGRYTPPAVLPVPNTVIVTATSVAAPTVSATATITLTNPYPTVASTLPTWVPVGAYTVTVNGSGFVAGSVVSIGGGRRRPPMFRRRG